jgi:glycosyltransferase involved in cell wall biosynthesis
MDYEVEVLAAVMHQHDFSLVEKMNLHCGAVIANQCDEAKIETGDYPFGQVLMVSTPSRGLALNRNISLLFSSGDILLFADEDVVYNDDAVQNIRSAYREHPDADAVFFGMELTKNGTVLKTMGGVRGRCHVWNSLHLGAVVLSVKREAVLKHGLCFPQLFGAGSLYGSGEDSSFILQCFRSGMKVYGSDYILGRSSKDSSSWFRGYDQKYFYDKGAWIRASFPYFRGIIMLIFAFRHRKKTTLGISGMLADLRAGAKGSESLKAYGKDG